MDLTKEPAAYLPGYVFYGRVTNSCHKGNQKPQLSCHIGNQKPKWISPRSQLLICLGMCFKVGSPTAVIRGIRSSSRSYPGASCSSLYAYDVQWDLPQLSQGKSEAPVDLFCLFSQISEGKRRPSCAKRFFNAGFFLSATP